MTVLVTGGCGFLGSQLVSRLASTGVNCVVLDDLSTGDPQSVAPSVGLLRGCVTSRSDVREAVAGVSLVYHAAAVVGQARVADYPAWAAEVSETSIRLLLEEAPNVPLVLYSTSAVYGLCSRGRCVESAILSERDALEYDGGVRGYAVGKWRSEQIALASMTRSPVLVVRPFNAVGPRQKGAYGMVLPRFVEKALRGEPLTIFGDGSQTRCFSASWTMTELLIRLVHAWQRGHLAHSVFNIGTPVETSIESLATELESEIGHPLSRDFRPFAEVYPGKTDVQQRLCCDRRLSTAIGPVRWPTTREIVRSVLADQRSRAAQPPAPLSPERASAPVY